MVVGTFSSMDPSIFSLIGYMVMFFSADNISILYPKKYKRYQENLKKGMSGYSAFREAYKKNKQSAPIRESKFQQRLKEIQNRQKHQ